MYVICTKMDFNEYSLLVKLFVVSIWVHINATPNCWLLVGVCGPLLLKQVIVCVLWSHVAFFCFLFFFASQQGRRQNTPASLSSKKKKRCLCSPPILRSKDHTGFSDLFYYLFCFYKNITYNSMHFQISQYLRWQYSSSALTSLVCVKPDNPDNVPKSRCLISGMSVWLSLSSSASIQ